MRTIDELKKLLDIGCEIKMKKQADGLIWIDIAKDGCGIHGPYESIDAAIADARKSWYVFQS